MRSRRTQGFTLLELMMVVGIVGLLASLATTSYRDYVIRAELAQQMVDVGALRTALAVDGRADLERGARPGFAPPALLGQMADGQFRGKEGLTLRLVHWPVAQTAPGTTDYAVIAQQPSGASVRRLALFHHEVQAAGFQRNAWLAPNVFVFALDVRGGASGGGSPPQPVPGATGSLPSASGTLPGGTNPSGAGSATTPPSLNPPAAASVPIPPPTASTPSSAVPAQQPPPVSVQPPAGNGGAPQGATSSGGVPQSPSQGAATGSGTVPTGTNACPTGSSATHVHGSSERCTPPRGQPCPSGWRPVGNSGTCRRV